MLQNIEVSVYCLAYNHEKYIRKALEGFVNQKTNFGYEVFVHDDASTDKTAKIIEEYATRYPDIIKPIYQTENQYSKGVKITTEIILPRMSGKYIAVCEGDDYWIDDCKLQKQYDILESIPSVAICTHRVNCVTEDDTEKIGEIPGNWFNFKGDKEFTTDQFSDFLMIRKRYAFHTSSYFARREVFCSKERSLLSQKMNGDMAIMYASLLYGNVYFIDQEMSNRRMMTMGNYNQRKKAFPIEKKIAHDLNIIDGYILFDELSKHEYRKKVLYCAYIDLITHSIITYPKQKEVKKYFKKFKKDNPFDWRISSKLNIAYVLFIFCPIVFRKIMLNKRKKASKK